MNPTQLFWLAAFALAVVILALLVWPLMRRRNSVAPGDEDATTAIFRDHKRQLDEEFAAGTITVAERDAAQAELVSRFGTELAVNAPAAARQSDRSRWIAAILVVAVLPATAGLMYAYLGNPAAVVAPRAAAPGSHATGGATDPEIVAMIERLAVKMKAEPDDPKGWILLGRSYLKLGRFDDAEAAFAEAAKRMPEDAGLLADQAEAIAMVQGQRLSGRPTELLNRALALNPNDPKTLAMSGSAAAEAGDFASAIKYYTRLKALVAPNSEDAQQIDKVLAELETLKKGGPAGAAAAAPEAAPAPAPVAAATAPAAAAAGAPAKGAASAPAASAAGSSISGRVEIDPKLKAQMTPGDALFIFARNAEGSRMPLAILKGAASELPKTFTLTDAMAMTPAATISLAKSIVVEARVSKAGTAAAQPGDLRGMSAPLSPGATNVRIVIDQVVP